MFGWLMGRRKRELPEYSRLRTTLSRPLPRDLVTQEQGEAFDLRRKDIQNELRGRPYWPPEDQPLFTTLLVPSQGGMLTIVLPDRPAPCLPVFSTPFKAADYRQVLVSSRTSVQYLSSTPLECQRMLSDLLGTGVETFALDRCPRCGVFSVIGSRSLRHASDLLQVWCIHKSTEVARTDLYFGYALGAARDGALEVAREVALETVGHVSVEDPRSHLLLGQLAVALQDRSLLAEAKAFLRFLKLGPWEQKLADVEGSASPDFRGPAWPSESRGRGPMGGWT